jgi:hypothetical protein
MNQKKLNRDSEVQNMPVTKPASTVNDQPPAERMTFNQLCECMNNFFNDRDFESKQAFKKGYTCTVGEDYTNIDLLCNMNDLVYNYCNNNENISKTEKRNLKTLCNGINSITMSMEQYNITTQMDKVLISTLMGYILKITRNYFHDRH